MKYQEARYRLTNYTYNKMASHKGIGVNEVSTKCAFYAPSPARTDWNWYVTAADAVDGNVNYGRAWDNDYVLIGHLARPFVVRGGGCSYGSSAGVLYSDITGGNPYYDIGFRAVLVV